jgi:hypothetical protein
VSRQSRRDNVPYREIDKCPRPEKIAYPTRGGAKQGLKDMQGHGRGPAHGITVYPCPCGWFHLGRATAQLRAGLREMQARDRGAAS